MESLAALLPDSPSVYRAPRSSRVFWIAIGAVVTAVAFPLLIGALLSGASTGTLILLGMFHLGVFLAVSRLLREHATLHPDGRLVVRRRQFDLARLVELAPGATAVSWGDLSGNPTWEGVPPAAAWLENAAGQTLGAVLTAAYTDALARLWEAERQAREIDQASPAATELAMRRIDLALDEATRAAAR